MTGFAGLLGHEFFGNSTGMYVFMAIHTPDLRNSKIPFTGLFMAGNTWSCQVSPFQCELCPGMFFNGKERRSKPVNGVTIRAFNR
jgi:hypothetical protein